ncbi:glycosyltransferase family 4 protein [Nisaea sediminum]|uniref:glycosyltransferase family 4 protein n=1 Tax=Nisaea sediminum TaxID=2775867 RepID=UPI0018694702|nr:glycosyltransferase [Nisaea sediminum]
MRVFVDDGNRHLKASGYGALSRAILLSLKRHTNLELQVKSRKARWDEGISNKDELMGVPESDSPLQCDVALRVGTPEGSNNLGIPTVVYTQNALGDLKPEWIESLRSADSIIVPGAFDEKIFKRYFNNVYICHQYVDPNVFKPYLKYRNEGKDDFTFLFVGSYSYRKGVDLLFPAFKGAFSAGEKVHLRLHCFSGLEKDGVSHLLSESRQLPSNIEVSAFSGTTSPPWMCRMYNRADCVVSLSRGEGWCMPLHEGLLCGKPVVAPASTAMAESLPRTGVYRVQATETEVAGIQSEFGYNMKNHYGFAGNTFWEPDVHDAARALRGVFDDYSKKSKPCHKGRDYIVKKYTLSSMADKIYDVLQRVLNN